MKKQNGEVVDRSVVDRVIVASAPECERDLWQVWSDLDPKIYIFPDESGILLEAHSSGINFSNRFMRVFWLLGFSCWDALIAYSPSVVVAGLGRGKVSDVLNEDEGYSDYRSALEKLLECAKSIQNGLQNWPTGIPHPQEDDNGFDVEQKAAFQLLTIGLSYAFLHEIEHIRHATGGNEKTAEEEVSCDVFARSFLTSRINSFCKASGENYESVVSKRAMGIALGAFVLGETTPSDGRSGAIEYPPLIWRLRALLDNMPLPENDKFWVFGSSLLITLARLHERSLDAVTGNPKEIFEKLMDMIEQRW